MVCWFFFVVSFFSFFFLPSATYIRKSKGFLGNKRKLAITILSVVVPLFLVPLLAYMWLIKKRKTKGNKIASVVLSTHICVPQSPEKNVSFIRSHLD